MIIQDGTGTGSRARVDGSNRLATIGVGFPLQVAGSLTRGDAFQAVTGKRTIATAGQTDILALRNDDAREIVITYIRIGVDGVETGSAQCELLIGGTWVDGTTLGDPINTNGGATTFPGVTVHKDMTPTSPSILDMAWITGNQEKVWRKEGSIVLPRNTHLALRITTATNGASVHGRISYVRLSEGEIEVI